MFTSTDIQTGLVSAKDEFDNNGRPEALRVVLLLLSDTGDLNGAVQASNNLKQENVVVFGIGVADDPDLAQLKQIASSSSKVFVRQIMIFHPPLHSHPFLCSLRILFHLMISLMMLSPLFVRWGSPQLMTVSSHAHTHSNSYDSDFADLDTGAIVGGVVGGVAAASVASLAAYKILKKKLKGKADPVALHGDQNDIHVTVNPMQMKTNMDLQNRLAGHQTADANSK